MYGRPGNYLGRPDDNTLGNSDRHGTSGWDDKQKSAVSCPARLSCFRVASSVRRQLNYYTVVFVAADVGAFVYTTEARATRSLVVATTCNMSFDASTDRESSSDFAFQLHAIENCSA